MVVQMIEILQKKKEATERKLVISHFTIKW